MTGVEDTGSGGIVAENVIGTALAASVRCASGDAGSVGVASVDAKEVRSVAKVVEADGVPVDVIAVGLSKCTESFGFPLRVELGVTFAGGTAETESVSS